MNVSVLFSIYIDENPVYFDEMLNSLSVQTYCPEQIVCVIDGPLNESLEEVLNRHKNQNITFVFLESNYGLATALSEGLKACTGDIIVRIDTDDILHSERINKQRQFLCDNPQIDICGSFAYDIDEQSSILEIRKVPMNHCDIVRMIWTCPIIHPSVSMRRKFIEKIGGYDYSIPSRQEDYELWIRAARNGAKFHNLPMALIYYRYPAGSELKNTIPVALNRIKIGWKAVSEFDPRLLSYVALFYPLVRALMPRFVRSRVVNVIKLFDPRRN